MNIEFYFKQNRQNKEPGFSERSLFYKTFSMITFLTVVLSFTASAQTAASPGADADLPNPYDVRRKGKIENNYLMPILELQAREADYLASKRWRRNYLEAMPNLYSYVGDEREMYRLEEIFLSDLELFNKQRAHNAAEIKTSPLVGFEPRNALDAVASLAGERQIVITNEEHRTPVHRAFTLQLLSRLYAKGFRYFAAETLEESDTELNKRGYPTQKTGTYTDEPVFGDLIRTALKLGFKVVPYEHNFIKKCVQNPEKPFECAELRERGQAQNIYDRILKDSPKAKILVHAGRAHAAKLKDDEAGLAMMAWHLREISGIEPFTVDQVHFSERKNPADEKPLYRFVTKQTSLKVPTVFQSVAGKFFTDSEGYDVRIFTPRAEYVNNRPTWLAMNGLRKSVSIDFKKLKIKTAGKIFGGREPILVQAFFAAEGMNAIPVDQIVIYPGKDISDLMLPKGTFLLRAIDKTGLSIGSYSAKVK